MMKFQENNPTEKVEPWVLAALNKQLFRAQPDKDRKADPELSRLATKANIHDNLLLFKRFFIALPVGPNFLHKFDKEGIVPIGDFHMDCIVIT